MRTRSKKGPHHNVVVLKKKITIWAPLFLSVMFAISVGKSIGESPTSCHQYSMMGGLRDRNHHSVMCDMNVSKLCGDDTAFLHSNRPGINKDRHKIIGDRAALQRFTPIVVDHDVARRVFLLHQSKADDGGDNDGGGSDAIIDDEGRFEATKRDNWIDGRQMMKIIAQEESEKQRRENRIPKWETETNYPGILDDIRRKKIQNGTNEQFELSPKNSNDANGFNNFVSRISYTDANTLQIELPPSGVDANVFFTGSFSALWFRAVAPATVSMLSAGGLGSALFMAPFWLAGGVVAKSAVYDPFVSSTLSIGQYLWTVEKNYFKGFGLLRRRKKEGATESLNGASVELAMVVNNVGRYQLRLSFDDRRSITLGKGLAQEELEDLSRVINDHCTVLRDST